MVDLWFMRSLLVHSATAAAPTTAETHEAQPYHSAGKIRLLGMVRL